MKIRIGLETSPGGTYYAIKGGSYNTNDAAMHSAIQDYCKALTVQHLTAATRRELVREWCKPYREASVGAV